MLGAPPLAIHSIILGITTYHTVCFKAMHFQECLILVRGVFQNIMHFCLFSVLMVDKSHLFFLSTCSDKIVTWPVGKESHKTL